MYGDVIKFTIKRNINSVVIEQVKLKKNQKGEVSQTEFGFLIDIYVWFHVNPINELFKSL